METVDRRRMALQLAAGLCFLAAVLQLLGGTFFFLLAGVGYAVAGVGLIEQSRSTSQWGVRVACAWTSLNGLINLGMLGYIALLFSTDSASSTASGVLVNNVVWLIANVIVFGAALWGSSAPEERSHKNSGML